MIEAPPLPTPSHCLVGECTFWWEGQEKEEECEGGTREGGREGQEKEGECEEGTREGGREDGGSVQEGERERGRKEGRGRDRRKGGWGCCSQLRQEEFERERE